MTSLNNAPHVIFGFGKKMLTFENGALFAVSLPASHPMKELFDILFQGIAFKTYLMPMAVLSVCLGLYLLAYISDFITGLMAAYKEAEGKKGWFESGKGWSSIWKLFVIYLMLFMSAVLSLMFLVLGWDTMYKVFIYAMITITIMASLLDIHSIGENLLRRYNKKPAIFNWLDGVYSAINETILKKIRGL